MTFFKTLLASALGFFLSLAIVMLLFFVSIIGFISSVGSDQAPAVRSGSLLTIEFGNSLPEHSAVESFRELFGEGGSLALRDYLWAIDDAAEDEKIVGIWLKPSGFPGDWSQAEEIRAKLLEFRKAGKFIFASSDVHGFEEREYFLATAADSIFLDPSASMEINGIAAALTFFKPALDRLGIQPEIVRAGSFKNAVEPFLLDSSSVESRQMMQQLVDGIFEVFKVAVTESRGVSPSALQQILDERGLLTAEETVQLRLADAVLYDDQLLTLLKRRAGHESDKQLPDVEIADYADPARRASGGGKGVIAIVYASGMIAAGTSGNNPNPLFGGESIGSETFASAMRSARESERTKAVVLRIDSPGGDASASEAMWREIRLTAEKKPVIVSMGSAAASGGYYLAAAADTIVAEATTITGSIGVFRLGFNVEQFFEETLGINTQVITSDRLSDMGSPFRPSTPLERSILERHVDTTYQMFLSVVAQGRNMSMDRVRSLAEGRVYTGAEAQRLGLVDELGGLDRALEIAAARAGLGTGYGINVLPRAKSLVESLSEMLEMQIAGWFRSDSPASRYRELLDALERMGGMQMRMPPVRIR